MQLTLEQKNALANEARRQTASLKVENLKGQITAIGSAAQVLSSLSADASAILAIANQELSALQSGAGPGLAANYGNFSVMEQLLRIERFAGKGAAVDFVKANPACTEADALKAWQEAAAKATKQPKLLQDPGTLTQQYRTILKAQGKIKEDTWEAHRAWIAATPKEEILGI